MSYYVWYIHVSVWVHEPMCVYEKARASKTLGVSPLRQGLSELEVHYSLARVAGQQVF